MSRTEHHHASRWHIFTLAILCVLITSLSNHAYAQMSADDILQKSQEAMKPPIQYRIRTSGIDAKVSQMIMPISRGPLHSKWSDQSSVRRLKSRTRSSVSGTYAETSLPL